MFTEGICMMDSRDLTRKLAVSNRGTSIGRRDLLSCNGDQNFCWFTVSESSLDPMLSC